MNELSRRESIGLVALLLLITLGASAFAWREMRPDSAPIVIHEPASPPSGSEPARLLKVHVAGAVKKPGVYALAEGARGEDALKTAGGALPSADPDAVNLAARLEDGQRLEIPLKAPPVQEKPAPSSHSKGKKSAKAPPARKININTASMEELQTLPGVGVATAEKIVQVRRNTGGFRATRDIMQVQGISAEKFRKMEPFLRAD